MTSGDMSSMLSQAEYSQKMHEYDREQLKEYTNTVTEIENLQKTLEEEQKNLEATEKEYEAEQATLTETINSKKMRSPIGRHDPGSCKKSRRGTKSRGRTPTDGKRKQRTM